MSSKNDGGPAFPRPPFSPGTLHDNAADAGFAATGHPGMSLRDWFAGQETLADYDPHEASMPKWAAEALAGRQRPDCLHLTKAENWIEMLKWEADWRAVIKYIRADAMLRAREKSQAPSASGASGGSCNPYDAASPYAGPVVFDGNAKGLQ